MSKFRHHQIYFKIFLVCVLLGKIPMPRLCYPARPIFIVPEIIKSQKYYILISQNGYIFHHSDKRWRAYRLKDERKFGYLDYRQACAQCGQFNRYYGHWLGI